MAQPNLTYPRHPELVSGSIVPFARTVGLERNETALLPDQSSAHVDKWTLKQVQGDEIWDLGGDL